ncbi:MAG: acyltransferase family protein [Planctomycetota bacterium]|nr:acyltransferase family protein [Planctomycetota bacterium]
MSSLNYRSEIDGLRAISVIAVVLFHAGLGCSGGYVGVDVFFVISGYLITSLIRKDLKSDSFSFLGFWERRIRRLFPALAVLLASSIVAGCILLMPGDLRSLSGSILSQLGLGSNVWFWFDTDYFADTSEFKQLLHTWSLAVEEQFYLGYPVLLYLLRRLKERQLSICLWSITGASFLLSCYTLRIAPDATFFLLPSRAWEMCLGGVLSALPATGIRSTWGREVLGWCGLTALAYATFFYTAATPFPGPWAVIPCLGATAILLATADGKSTVRSILSFPPLVFFGLISYSLYLWHWPVLSFMRYAISDQLEMSERIVAVVVGLVVAILSWRFVETPFRRSTWYQGKRLAYSTGLMILLLAGASGWIYVKRGMIGRWPTDLSPVKWGTDKKFHSPDEKPANQDRLPRIGEPTDESPDFVVWGDSHSSLLGPMLDELAAERKLSGAMACRMGYIPVVGAWNQGDRQRMTTWNDAIVAYVKRNQVKNVILVGFWSSNVNIPGNGDLMRVITSVEGQPRSSAEAEVVLKNALERTVIALNEAGAKVWVMRQVPVQKEHIARQLSRWYRSGSKEAVVGIPLEVHRREQSHVNPAIDAACRDRATIIEVDDECFDSNGHSRVIETRLPLYLDTNHLSQHGTHFLLRRKFAQVLDEIARAPSEVPE